MSAKIMSKPFVIGATALAVASGVAGYVWREDHRQAVLEIYVLDLKSGQAIFIRTPSDRRILIDGGANAEIVRHLSRILPFYSRRLDTIIATDTDAKSVSGLVDVIERYAVDRVIVPSITLASLGLAATDQAYSVFIDAVGRKGVVWEEIAAGQHNILDGGAADNLFPEISLDVVFPISPELFKYSKTSAPKLLFRVSYGSTSVFFLGNATQKIQRSIVTQYDDLVSERVSALVVSNSASPDDLFSGLMSRLHPDHLIYSRSLTRRAPSPKDKKTDPLFFVIDDHRFNLEERGTVKIVSDGSRVTVF